MVLFPPCKINIGLHVTAKRPDGFHAIESIFYPVQWNDVLEIVPSANKESSFFLTGQQVTAGRAKNIVWKAFDLLQKDFPHIAAEIHLHKNIPTGAGLGGGSSDGAQALILMNELFHLGLEQAALELYAGQLGSDCPFFVEAKPKFVEGRGEIMSAHRLDLSNTYIVIAHPGLHVSTADAYRLIRPKPADYNLRELDIHDLHNWKNYVTNDFEEPVVNLFPEIGGIKNKMYALGAVYASMSGSGSAVFGLFNTKPSDMQWPSHYKTFEGPLPL
jgi:4-diphosphocytidyl-2-C-methyl-D-erythritol kinase